MKMPLGWAKEFAHFECTPQEFADRMTMSGSKVECWSSEADEISNVVVGKILSIEDHPDSDHLVICQVEVGKDAPEQIVTGASNLKVGDLVPAALHNSTLPGGVKITKGKLRGVPSNGMLCSLGELGLTTHDFPNAIENGIMVLDEEWAPGTPIVKALGLDDVNVEFEITPNRPDCLAVRGLGREAAATFGVPFIDHVPQVKPGHGDVNEMLKVSVENTQLCYRYCGAVVENVRVKPSPRWLRERLRGCGVRPINNLVDITNYVMLEYGQPMHCFDYQYVNGKHIHVRNANEGETIMTLDGVERKLSPEMLIIADDKCPIAVAGVMGGEYSGTYDNTTTVVFESAMFNGPSVRVTGKKIGLRTESSGRFEKGLDPNTCDRALKRALELVQLLDAGDVVNGIIDVYPTKREKRRIKLRPATINTLLGTDLDRQQMVDILLPLGFEMDGDDVVCPTDRWDMERDCDIAEEVARYVGYNKMPSTVMKGIAQARPTARQDFDEKMTRTLAGYGLWECENFSFYSAKCFDMINLAANDPLRNAVRISNPLGEDTSIMRTTALPSILDVVARNYNARATDCAVYELATEYIPSPLADEVADNDFNDYPALCKKLAAEGKTPSDLLPAENQTMVMAAYGGEWDYLAMKGIVEKLLATAGLADWEVRRTTAPTWHPGRAAELWMGDKKIGTMGELHPLVCANYGVKVRVVAAQLDMDAVFSLRQTNVLFKPLPRHPATTRDLALVAAADVPAADMVKCIQDGAGKILESLTLFDIYTGEKLGEGKKSLAYNLVFRAPDRTLTDEDVEGAVKKILKNLEAIHVTLRS